MNRQPVDLQQRLWRHLSRRLGTDVTAAARGEVIVVACGRRMRREPSYGKPFPVLLLLTRGRCFVSVRPDLAAAARQLLSGLRSSYRMLSPGAGRRWARFCGEHLPERLAPRGWQFFRIPSLTCFRPAPMKPVAGARVVDGKTVAGVDSALHVNGPHLKKPDEISCCVIYRGRIVAEALTLSVGDARVGSIGIATAAACRRRGFGRLALTALTQRLIDDGRVPLYETADYNAASVATARSAGYHRCGLMLRVQAR